LYKKVPFAAPFFVGAAIVFPGAARSCTALHCTEAAAVRFKDRGQTECNAGLSFTARNFDPPRARHLVEIDRGIRLGVRRQPILN
jgi:hypothetical protein